VTLLLLLLLLLLLILLFHSAIVQVLAVISKEIRLPKHHIPCEFKNVA